jgi:hypothetical protein
MTTDNGSYETPRLTEIGSIRSVTRGDIFNSGQDGAFVFGFPLGANPPGHKNSHS